MSAAAHAGAAGKLHHASRYSSRATSRRSSMQDVPAWGAGAHASHDSALGGAAPSPSPLGPSPQPSSCSAAPLGRAHSGTASPHGWGRGGRSLELGRAPHSPSTSDTASSALAPPPHAAHGGGGEGLAPVLERSSSCGSGTGVASVSGALAAPRIPQAAASFSFPGPDHSIPQAAASFSFHGPDHSAHAHGHGHTHAHAHLLAPRLAVHHTASDSHDLAQPHMPQSSAYSGTYAGSYGGLYGARHGSLALLTPVAGGGLPGPSVVCCAPGPCEALAAMGGASRLTGIGAECDFPADVVSSRRVVLSWVAPEDVPHGAAARGLRAIPPPPHAQQGQQALGGGGGLAGLGAASSCGPLAAAAAALRPVGGAADPAAGPGVRQAWGERFEACAHAATGSGGCGGGEAKGTGGRAVLVVDELALRQAPPELLVLPELRELSEAQVAQLEQVRGWGGGGGWGSGRRPRTVCSARRVCRGNRLSGPRPPSSGPSRWRCLQPGRRGLARDRAAGSPCIAEGCAYPRSRHPQPPR